MNNDASQLQSLLAVGLGLLAWMIVIILLVSFIVKTLFSKTKSQQKAAPTTSEPDFTKYKYLLRQHIMTTYEEKFFITLCEIFDDKCYVLPQVHLSKILDHKVKQQNWQGAFSHINGKSVDFILLKKSDLSILCAIELDDWSHNLDQRKKRDREIERLFKEVKLPLVRFKSVDVMAKQQIVDRIAEAINRSQNST